MANRYAHLNEPDDTLDFHGRGRLTSGDVKQATESFVTAAHKRGCARVRIITGKGLHSAGAPKVKPQVERTLAHLEARGLVASYRPERRDRGGEGAFFVILTTS